MFATMIGGSDIGMLLLVAVIAACATHYYFVVLGGGDAAGLRSRFAFPAPMAALFSDTRDQNTKMEVLGFGGTRMKSKGPAGVIAGWKMDGRFAGTYHGVRVSNAKKTEAPMEFALFSMVGGRGAPRGVKGAAARAHPDAKYLLTINPALKGEYQASITRQGDGGVVLQLPLRSPFGWM